LWPVVGKLGLKPEISSNKWEDFSELLRAAKSTAKIRVSLDGKFLGIIELPQEHMGDSEYIFTRIKCQKPRDLKRVDAIACKTSLSDFKRVMVQPGKPVINFIT
jgi:hypothetical protein